MSNELTNECNDHNIQNHTDDNDLEHKFNTDKQSDTEKKLIKELDLPCGIRFIDKHMGKMYMDLCEEQKVSIEIHNLQVDASHPIEESKYYDLPNEFYPEVPFIKKGLNRMQGRFMRVQNGQNIHIYECFSFFYKHPKNVPDFYRGSEIVNLMDNIKSTFLCIDSKTMDILDGKHCYFVKYEDPNHRLETHIAVLYSDKDIQSLDKTYLCSFDPDTMATEGIMIFGTGRIMSSNDDIRRIRLEKIRYLNGDEDSNIVVNTVDKKIEQNQQSSKDKKEDDTILLDDKAIKIKKKEIKRYIQKQIQESDDRMKELDKILSE